MGCLGPSDGCLTKSGGRIAGLQPRGPSALPRLHRSYLSPRSQTSAGRFSQQQPPASAGQERSKTRYHGGDNIDFPWRTLARRQLHLPRVRVRALPRPLRIRGEEEGEEGQQVADHLGPPAVVPGRQVPAVAGRLPGGRLRIRPLGPGQAGGVPAVRPRLAGPEPGQEPRGRRHRNPIRDRRRQVHPLPALLRGLRPAALPRVRAHPRPLGHARHSRRPRRRVPHGRHLAGRGQGGARGRVDVPGAAAALLDLDVDLDRGARDRVHRVPEERGAGPGEEALPRGAVLRSPRPRRRPGEEGETAAG